MKLLKLCGLQQGQPHQCPPFCDHEKMDRCTSQVEEPEAMEGKQEQNQESPDGVIRECTPLPEKVVLTISSKEDRLIVLTQ